MKYVVYLHAVGLTDIFIYHYIFILNISKYIFFIYYIFN